MLMRFDPFRDLDRMADQLGRSQRTMLAMDAVRTDDELTIYIDLPGVSDADVDVTVEKNELTVSAERRWSAGGSERVVASERPQGAFSRRFMLSDAVDSEKLEAELSNGVLTITVPVAERSKQRKINVSGNSSKAKPIDTTAKESATSNAGGDKNG